MGSARGRESCREAVQGRCSFSEDLLEMRCRLRTSARVSPAGSKIPRTNSSPSNSTITPARPPYSRTAVLLQSENLLSALPVNFARKLQATRSRTLLQRTAGDDLLMDPPQVMLASHKCSAGRSGTWQVFCFSQIAWSRLREEAPPAHASFGSSGRCRQQPSSCGRIAGSAAFCRSP